MDRRTDGLQHLTQPPTEEGRIITVGLQFALLVIRRISQMCYFCKLQAVVSMFD